MVSVPHRPPRSRRTPSLRLHRASGRGFVELNRHRHYLGKYDDPTTRAKYHALIAEWLTQGRLPLIEPELITVDQVVDRFMAFARQHYVSPAGSPLARPVTTRRRCDPSVSCTARRPQLSSHPGD